MIQPNLRVSFLRPATTQFEQDPVSEAHTHGDLRLRRVPEQTLVIATPWDKLQKPEGGIRGIATSTSFRRLVAKTMAKQFMTDVEQACAPFQFALSTRAGTDCVGHAVRVVTDHDPEMTVLSIDGIGAYDHVYRSSILSKLHEIPSLRSMLPFVRKTYARASTYWWSDKDGVSHRIGQHQGGEQGDPLMPLLFSLAIHNALAEVKEQLLDGEFLFAFLDDVYVLAKPDRIRTIYDLLSVKLSTMAGIQLHTGKTRTWNKAGVCPARMAELELSVWSHEGIKILGTPVGSAEFVQRLCEERIAQEEHLWQAIPWVPDLQSGWQILLQCASPRCHHFLRTLPPSESAWYARHHDAGMMEAMEEILGGLPGDEVQKGRAKEIATMPMRLGGLGLRSAARMAPAAFWASWADALPMISKRLPEVANRVTVELTEGQNLHGCVHELAVASEQLDRHGFVDRPGWADLQRGARPPVAVSVEPGEWQHGWQHHASSSSEYHYRETVMFAQSCASDMAHLRSHSGPGAGDVFHGSPTHHEFEVQPGLFRTLILERLRLPLHVTDVQCECGSTLDRMGRHRAACARSGRLKTRALPTERTLARVCREAGATVRRDVKLRDMNISVQSRDERAIEVLAMGLPIQQGAQLAVDITLRSALTTTGEPCPNGATTNGAALQLARHLKEAKYWELLEGDRCRLVVIGVETGGRFSPEAVSFVDALAAAKARDSPPVLRRSAHLAWRRRWMRMLAVSCGRSFAASLVAGPSDVWSGTDGCVPDLADLFLER